MRTLRRFPCSLEDHPRSVANLFCRRCSEIYYFCCITFGNTLLPLRTNTLIILPNKSWSHPAKLRPPPALPPFCCSLVSLPPHPCCFPCVSGETSLAHPPLSLSHPMQKPVKFSSWSSPRVSWHPQRRQFHFRTSAAQQLVPTKRNGTFKRQHAT